MECSAKLAKSEAVDHFRLSNVLTALAQRLDPQQAHRAIDLWLIEIIVKPAGNQWSVRRSVSGDVLVVLAPQMEPKQAKLAWDGLIGLAENANNQSTLPFMTNAITAVAPRLEAASRERLLTIAATDFLDCGSSRIDGYNNSFMEFAGVPFVASISSVLRWLICSPIRVVREWDANRPFGTL